MPRSYLYVDDSRTNSFEGQVADWTEIAREIERFDHRFVRMIVIGEGPPGDDDELPFSGKGIIVGRALAYELYVVQAYYPEQNKQFNLFAETTRVDSIEVMLGRSYPIEPDAVVPLAVALGAVRHFIETGEIDPSLSWSDTYIW